jgi:hypothetical protein
LCCTASDSKQQGSNNRQGLSIHWLGTITHSSVIRHNITHLERLSMPQQSLPEAAMSVNPTAKTALQARNVQHAASSQA